MDPPHESIFGYNITRPYPFRWFTPVALVCGLVLAVLFTAINYASAGFLLAVEASADPNATMSNNPLPRLPSFLTSKIQPTCQPVTLPVGSRFFTNQTALVYTLTSVWKAGDKGSGSVVSPSLTYFHNALDDCSVNSIQIDVESQDRAANQLALTEWGAVVRTYATCRINTGSELVFFNLTQTYDYVPDTVSFAQIATFLGSGFVSRDQQKRASLWWGESLLSTYWMQMASLLQNETRERNEYPIRKGTLSFVPQTEGVEITNTSFFRFSSQFIHTTEPGEYQFPTPEGGDKATLDNLIQEGRYPNIWSPADNLAKSAYSTVLTDLGQTWSKPNILTDAAALEFFTSGLRSAQKDSVNAHPGPATQSYEELKHLTGPLAANPSVISAQYICQVPRRRSAVNLALTVLLADLVFLQAAWALYKLGVDWWLGRAVKAWSHCRGCLDGEVHETDSIPMLVPSNPRKSYEMMRQCDVEAD